MATAKEFTSILCTIVLISIVHSSKLNVPRVLLPIFSDFSSKFTLEAIEGGCYKWSTTRNDIIKIDPIDENVEYRCSSKLQVSAITREETKNLAVVLAEDVHTGQILKCDIVVDIIHELSIVTTTRELFMEEVPEVFHIVAYNVEGSAFSTLDGVEFDWSIAGLGSNKDSVKLRYLPFKDSSYEAPPHIAQLEDNSKKGSVILLEGVKTGATKVSVRLPHHEYRHVPNVEVTLTVIANLLLTPADTYMMVGDIISFKLFFMNSGRMDEIKLQDHQYYLEAEDKSVAVANSVPNEMSALQEGNTRVFLKSKVSNDDDPALKLPSVTIHVVNPAYLVLSLMVHKNWAILVGDQHDITIEIFSSSDHKLHLGPGVEIHTQIAEAFHVEERSPNGSWITGWGLKESRAVVEASLEAIVNPKHGKFVLATPLSASAELFIYPRITIIPPDVILPWDPQVRPKYAVELVARGGDGRFLWTSSDSAVGVVTQSGLVRTLSQGFFDVTASMARNHHNRQIARVSILPPVRLEIVEFMMEAEIGQPIHLHIALYVEKISRDNNTKTYVPVTQCQDLPFQVRQSDTKFVMNKTAIVTPVGISCGNIAMVGTSVGTTKVTVSYYQSDVLLEDSVTISAHNPLQLVHPTKEVVLAVGTSVNLVYIGGPRPQIGRQSDHQRIVISDHEGLVQAEDATDKHTVPGDEYTIVWVLCRKLGQAAVKLTISNTPTIPNCKTHGSVVQANIICGKPRRLHLQPELKVKDIKSCPMDLTADRVVVPSQQDIELNVIVQDELGRAFLNVTSLNINWEEKPGNLIDLETRDGIVTKPELLGTVLLTSRMHQVVKATKNMGLIELSATVTGYKGAVLKQHRITSEWPEFLSSDEKITDVAPITNTIGLFFVEDTQALPNITVVFNQANVKKIVTILHGSGYLEVSLNADDIAQVKYEEGARTIEIVPINTGDVTIQLNDLCLVTSPVFISVKVVTVGKIEVVMSDKVEVNHCIECVVRLYDENDQLLDVNEMGDVDLRFRMSKMIANLGRTPQNVDQPWPLGEIHYILTGVELGNTQLTFSFENNGQDVMSAPIDLQVFPPLKLSPRNSTLLPGATLQVIVKGGPQPDSNIEFVSLSNKTIEVSDTGIAVGRKLGTTRIIARSTGVHPQSGDKVIYSEDAVDMTVIDITGVKIASPLTRFKVGSNIPCWVTGVPDRLSPLILASFEDGSVQYEWYFADDSVAAFNGVFATVGVVYKVSDRAVVRVSGLQPGLTRLYVNVTLNGIKPKKPRIQYNAFIDLEVFEPMILTNPAIFDVDTILMARQSMIQLKTNLEYTHQMKYRISGYSPRSVTEDGGRPSIEQFVRINEVGFVETGTVFGQAILSVQATGPTGIIQIMSYVIEVRPVHYMMLSVNANWRIHLDSSLQVLPLGTEFELIANFFDNLGNQFNAGPKTVKVRSNRLDLVKFQHFSNNASVHVSIRKSGHTVVKLWTDGLDNTADYVRVHAEEVVKPVVDSLTPGDIICLSSPVMTKQNVKLGQWTTSDLEMLEVDPSTDIAFVVGNKRGNVLLTHNLHPHAPLTMQVLPIQEVVILPKPNLIFTNGAENTVISVGFVFRNKVGPTDKTNNLIQGWLCSRALAEHTIPTPFTCSIAFTNESVIIDANSLFSIHSVFESQIGQYRCKFISNGANASEVSVLETNITLRVISELGGIESKPVELPFVPSVYANAELLIGDSGSVGELSVKGLEHVLKQIIVQPVDSSILYVDSGKVSSPTRKKFKVHLIDYHSKFADSFDTMGIIIQSPISQQVLKVMVKVTNKYKDENCGMGKSPLVKFVQQYRHSLIIVISMIIIFCLTCYAYSRYMQPVVNVNVHPTRSLLSNAGTTLGAIGKTSTPVCQSAHQVPSRFSPTSPICTNKTNCTCCRKNYEPVYGDISAFSATSPELRRNRRFL